MVCLDRLSWCSMAYDISSHSEIRKNADFAAVHSSPSETRYRRGSRRQCDAGVSRIVVRGKALTLVDFRGVQMYEIENVAVMRTTVSRRERCGDTRVKPAASVINTKDGTSGRCLD